MNRRSLTESRIAPAVVLTTGLAFLWGMFGILVGTMAMWLRNPGVQVYENFQIAMDGTPVIVTRSYADYRDVTYRTLEGQPLPEQANEVADFQTGASLPEPIKPPQLFEMPVNWTSRIAALSDMQRPPTAWYVARDDDAEDRAYIVGYDEISRRPAGYIGRNGFRHAPPPDDEWFDVGRRLFTWGTGALTTTGSIQFGAKAIPYASQQVTADERMPGWLLFLIDGDRLVEINLRSRDLRTVYESPGLVSVSVLLQPQPSAADEADADAEQENQADTRQADENRRRVANRSKMFTRIALRTDDRIVILDPPTGHKREFRLPEAVRERSLQVFAANAGQLLLQSQELKTQLETELIWLAADRTIARSKWIAHPTVGGRPEEAIAMSVFAMPVPLVWVGGIFVASPITMLQSNLASNYAEAVSRGLEYGWLGTVAVILIGALLAALTYRIQRKYYRGATGIWCAFVFLLGWPAFLAYWLEQRWPRMETCGECGAVVPRDRDTCAACHSLFPNPPRVGTEIFA